jgi:predicted GNAT family acetyltransferase
MADDDGNMAAIQLYESLGFKYRTTFYLSFLRRAQG